MSVNSQIVAKLAPGRLVSSYKWAHRDQRHRLPLLQPNFTPCFVIEISRAQIQEIFDLVGLIEIFKMADREKFKHFSGTFWGGEFNAMLSFPQFRTPLAPGSVNSQIVAKLAPGRLVGSN